MSFQADTLFLDRDGVINYKIEGKYIKDNSEFIFIPGVLEAIKILNTIFKRIIIITNQQGIGKGIMTHDELLDLHEFMISRLEESGGKIDKIYYCPHLASENCTCRKPASGMIKKAIQDFPDIKIKDSYLIGDSKSDIEAGIKENLHTVRVDSQYTLSEWCHHIIE